MSDIVKRLREFLKGALRRSVSILLSILAAMVVGSLIMIWYKQNPVEIYAYLFKGAFGSQRSLFIISSSFIGIR